MRSIRIVFLCLLGLAQASNPALGQNPKVEPNAGSQRPEYLLQIEKIQKEADASLQKDMSAFMLEMLMAKASGQVDSVRKRATEKSSTVYHEANRKILKVVSPHARDEASVAPLVWVINHGDGTAEANEAAEMLRVHHLTHKRTIDLVYLRRYGPMPWSEPLLRAQLASPNLPAADRPRLLMALALIRQMESKMPEILAQATDDHLAQLDRFYGKQQIESYRKIDVASVEAEAIGLFNELAQKYGAQMWDRGKTYGDFAKSSLYEMQHLSKGKFAPEIYGDDLDGVKLHLSEYRGKVVMLSFWATWCGPCMVMIPHEREIAARLKDKPFALIGVNADSDKKQLAEAVKKNGITWRSYWSGPKGSDGDIPKAWNVTAWPTVYVIDHKGVIRGKDLVGKKLDELLDQLVREAQENK